VKSLSEKVQLIASAEAKAIPHRPLRLRISQETVFKMPHRAASPALSENDFDITKSLFKDDFNADDDDFTTSIPKDLGTLDAGGILDLGIESDGEGDEAFIAAQQAASNRKASNVKGKSVKKGGGFQAMGS
jgi:ATP-dependent RNA helicase DDX54/DBP10